MATVDLSGNLGASSNYGKLNYGKAIYSQAPFAPSLAATTLTYYDQLSGNLTPVVTFNNVVMNIGQGLTGDLAPAISLGADLVVFGFVDLVGNLTPQIALGGSLSLDVVLTALSGSLATNVSLGATSLDSGPLWAASAPCPPPMWTPDTPCPDPGWISLSGPNNTVYQASAFGIGDYGAKLYGKGGYVPAEPSPWADAELCNG